MAGDGEERGGSRALVATAPGPAADGNEPAAPRRWRDSRAEAPFVVQILACRDGLNGYRARRRIDAGTGTARYAATDIALRSAAETPRPAPRRTVTVA